MEWNITFSKPHVGPFFTPPLFTIFPPNFPFQLPLPFLSSLLLILFLPFQNYLYSGGGDASCSHHTRTPQPQGGFHGPSCGNVYEVRQLSKADALLCQASCASAGTLPAGGWLQNGLWLIRFQRMETSSKSSFSLSLFSLFFSQSISSYPILFCHRPPPI